MNLTKSTQQIGNSCGIYCLVIACNLFKKNCITASKYNEILTECIENKYTFIGEVFDINKLLFISQKMFPSLKCEIHDINSPNDINTCLSQGFVILPINTKKNIPHYILLKSQDNQITAYNNAPHSHPKTVNLYELNKNIPNTFIWTKDIISPSLYSRIGIYIITFCVAFSTLKYKRNYNKLLKTSVKTNSLYVGYESNVNMNGKCILVTKPN